jgi:proline iminopeptidase
MTERAREEFVDAGGGVRLFCRSFGSRGPAILVLQGGPGFSMEYLAKDLEPLAAAHRVIFYDQRGSGRSTLVAGADALDAQRFVDDVDAVCRHFGLEQPILLGHSWGAGLAALHALREPARVGQLIIVGGIPLRHEELVRTFQRIEAARPAESREQLERRRRAWLGDPGDAAACRAYYETWYEPFFADRAVARASKGDFCAGSPAALRNKVEAVDRCTLASLGPYDWRDALRSVPARSLIVHGAEDVIDAASAREWATALPNARLLLLERVGHFPYLEAPERFFGAVETFVRGGWPDGAVDARADATPAA